MKSGFSFKLGIAVVAVFLLVVAGMFLYQPLRYKWLKSRLLSSDESTRNAAVKTIAADRNRAIPHLRRWLQSEDRQLVTASCRVLLKSKGDYWTQALPELEDILKRPPSELTDAAAELMLKKDYAMEDPNAGEDFDDWHRFTWKHYEKNSAIRRNICIYILDHVKDYEMRRLAGWELDEIGDPLALDSLIAVMESETDVNILLGIACALGATMDDRAVEPLIAAMKRNAGANWNILNSLGSLGDLRAVKPLLEELKKKDNYCSHVIGTLGKIGDPRAVEPLIEILADEPEKHFRENSALALGQIGDNRALMPLITALQNDNDSKVRDGAAKGLGMLGDDRAIAPLIKALKNDPGLNIQNSAAMAIACFEDEKIDAVLETARDNGVIGAAFALAWRRGGSNLDCAANLKGIDPYYWKTLAADVRARWGNAAALETIIDDLPYVRRGLRRFHKDVFSRMPDSFPDIDFREKGAVRREQAKAASRWYDKNKDRLAWDAEKNRYYLLPEKPESENKNH